MKRSTFNVKDRTMMALRPIQIEVEFTREIDADNTNQVYCPFTFSRGCVDPSGLMMGRTMEKICRRVFVSMVDDRLLSPSQNAFKWAVVDRIQALGFQPEIFHNPRTVEGIASRKSWTPIDADEVIRQCVAGVIIGMPRWRLTDGQQEVLMSSEFSQYEGAVLRTVNVPTMILAQENLFKKRRFRI